MLANNPSKESQVLSRLKSLLNSVCACGLMETIFYLPNHLRQIILVNSSNISFVNRDAALLDLMNVMFKINRGPNQAI